MRSNKEKLKVSKTITVTNLADLERAASEFTEALGDRRVVAFEGEMGAGKTTFIGALCRLLGVRDDVASPTFSIINEYRDAGANPIYHFDFYRIDELAQAADLGLDDYFYSGALCLMEWAENIEPLLPDDVVRVRLSVGSDGERTLEL